MTRSILSAVAALGLIAAPAIASAAPAAPAKTTMKQTSRKSVKRHHVAARKSAKTVARKS